MLYILLADSQESLRRDYQSSLSLEPRTTMNEENINKYNQSLQNMYPFYQQEINHVQLIDTNNRDIMEPAINIANDVLSKVKTLTKTK